LKRELFSLATRKRAQQYVSTHVKMGSPHGMRNERVYCFPSSGLFQTCDDARKEESSELGSEASFVGAREYFACFSLC
jgi:hypothetical protein